MKKQYGLIGYPVKHSKSALMHNAAFKALGIDAEYKLLEVKPHELKKFFGEFRKNLSGVNITIPHKVASIQYLSSVSKEVEYIGAVNTVVMEKNKLIGHNTDVLGFLESLKEDLGFDAKRIKETKAIVFGAGGAGHAVAFGLRLQGAKRIVLVDKDSGKAALLTNELSKISGIEVFDIPWDDAEAIKATVCDSTLLINATNCGMDKKDKVLLPYEFLHDGLAIFDLIYNRETSLIEEARRRSLKFVNGLNMLINQGAMAFKLWTGKDAPIDIMRKAISE
ncbi:MAG: shikimate dehydrogenase [Candidatus Omnitrophica bacterium]|nr:shikimate dehydrogenase [Candidatus Omnitrophota bacterium]